MAVVHGQRMELKSASVNRAGTIWILQSIIRVLTIRKFQPHAAPIMESTVLCTIRVSLCPVIMAAAVKICPSQVMSVGVRLGTTARTVSTTLRVHAALSK